MAKQRKFLKGKTSEENLDYLDEVIPRLLRRQHKVAKAMITPYPISTFTPYAGVAFRFMFPVEGKVLAGAAFVEKKPKSGYKMEFVLTRANGSSYTTSEFMDEKYMAVKPDLSVYAGDRLVVSVLPMVEGEEIADIWVSALWVPKIGAVNVQQFLIDELERIEAEGIVEVTPTTGGE